MNTDLDRVHAEIAGAVRAGLADPSPGFERRLLDAVRTPRPSSKPAGGRLAAVASVALGVVVVATLLWVSPAIRGRLPAPAARPMPAVTATAATPEAGFFYQSARPPQVGFGPLRRAGWAGAALPSIPAPNGTSMAVMVSPDGRYLTAPAGPVPTGAAHPPRRDTKVLDASGAVVASTPDIFDLWADDSRHLCRLLPAAGGSPPAILIGDVVPGRGVTTSAVPIPGVPGGSYLAACSFRGDQALLVSAVGGSGAARTVYAVRLSTGEVMFGRDLPAGMPVLSAWSDDGRYVAVSTAFISGIGTSSTRIASDIFDVDAGTVVAHVTGGVAGFSGDDRLLVVSDEQAVSAEASLIEWRSGRTVWSQQASWIVPGQVRSLPGEAVVAVAVARSGVAPDVVLVRSDGTAVVVARSGVLLTLGARGGLG